MPTCTLVKKCWPVWIPADTMGLSATIDEVLQPTLDIFEALKEGA